MNRAALSPCVPSVFCARAALSAHQSAASCDLPMPPALGRPPESFKQQNKADLQSQDAPSSRSSQLQEVGRPSVERLKQDQSWLLSRLVLALRMQDWLFCNCNRPCRMYTWARIVPGPRIGPTRSTDRLVDASGDRALCLRPCSWGAQHNQDKLPMLQPAMAQDLCHFHEIRDDNAVSAPADVRPFGPRDSGKGF